MKATRHLNRVGKHFRDSHESDLSERHQLYAIDLFENRIKADESLLTKQEIATFLNVSVKMIDRKVHRNEIPYFKVGRLVRFSKERVLAWAEESTPKE
jgi:excisionase family DNA binding protein